MKVYLFHIKDCERVWWSISDGKHTMTGRVFGTRREILAAWVKRFGAIASIIRIAGYCRPSEAAMELADIQAELAKETAS